METKAEKNKYVIYNENNDILVLHSNNSNRYFIPTIVILGKIINEYDDLNMEILKSLLIDNEKVVYKKEVINEKDKFLCINRKLKKIVEQKKKNYLFCYKEFNSGEYLELILKLQQKEIVVELLSYQELEKLFTCYQIDKDLIPVLKEFNDNVLDENKRKIIRKGDSKC